jgi:hypothetical protein
MALLSYFNDLLPQTTSNPLLPLGVDRNALLRHLNSQQRRVRILCVHSRVYHFSLRRDVRDYDYGVGDFGEEVYCETGCCGGGAHRGGGYCYI